VQDRSHVLELLELEARHSLRTGPGIYSTGVEPQPLLKVTCIPAPRLG